MVRNRVLGDEIRKRNVRVHGEPPLHPVRCDF